MYKLIVNSSSRLPIRILCPLMNGCTLGEVTLPALQLTKGWTPAERKRICDDPHMQPLANLVESFAEEWDGYATSSVAWAQATMGHGNPTILPKVGCSVHCHGMKHRGSTCLTRGHPAYVR